MATTLNGITLPDGMVWKERYSLTPIEGARVVTLGGVTHLYEKSLEAGQNITLSSLSDQGWMTKAQVDAVSALVSTTGATYTLVIGSDTFTIRFRQHDTPVFVVTPIIERAEYNAEDYFQTSIKMITV